MSTTKQAIYKTVLPTGWKIKRVAPDKVVVMQEGKDETSTYIADTRPGVPHEIFYRFVSDIADQPVPKSALELAAPALLAALVETLAEGINWFDDSTGQSPDDLEWVINARAAIAQATGEAV